MKITSSAVVDGWIQDKYGCKGERFVNGMPGQSIPF